MAEQKSLIVHVARQTLTTPAKPTASLVGRGLAAIRDGGALAKSQDDDVLYRKAREIYECYYFEYLCGNNWQESEHSKELTEAFYTFKRLAAEKYCKTYYPLSQLYRGMEQLENSQDLAKHFLEIAFEWCSSNLSPEDPDIWEDMGELYEKNNYLNYELAVFWYTRSAEQGNARAQFKLGLMYANGKGVEQDDTQAVYWYEKSAKQSNADAQCNLGWMYRNGKGVEQDDEQAVFWYEKAAEQGEAYAQRNLGWMYLNGKGVEQDDEQAVYWYEKAAEQGEAYAQNNLGFMYQNGRGVEQDDTQAVYWYEKSVEQGNVLAQRNLGWMYQNGRGVEQDDEQAIYWYKKAAEQGNEFAQINLNLLLEKRVSSQQDLFSKALASKKEKTRKKKPPKHDERQLSLFDD